MIIRCCSPNKPAFIYHSLIPFPFILPKLIQTAVQSMRNKYFIYLILVLMNPFFSCGHPKSRENGPPLPVEFSGISMQGELYTRANKNYDRLEGIG
jgi:hypothetical protein